MFLFCFHLGSNLSYLHITHYKIKNTAEDIVKEPEPVADIDMLLDTSNNPVTPEPVSPFQQTAPVETEEEPVQSGGKFFTMFNMNEEEINPNFVSDIESKEVNMDFGEPNPTTSVFNFDPINNVETTIEPQPVNNVTSEPTLNSEINFNNAVVQPSTIEPQINVQPEPIVQSVELKPEVESNTDLEKTMEFPSPFNPFDISHICYSKANQQCRIGRIKHV